MDEGYQIWMGTDSAHASYMLALQKKSAMQLNAQHKFGMWQDDEEDDEDPDSAWNYRLQGSVGVITIKGTLITGSADFYDRYFGEATGYDDIRQAVVSALKDKGATAILLNIGSGGGAVAQCQETAQLLARAGKIKPIVTYTGSQMSSAAYWLGSQAKYVVAAETAFMGSVGCLMMHVERSKMLKDIGITATVIREGSEKALASAVEPLSERAKAMLTESVKSLRDIFHRDVCAALNITVDEGNKRFGTGAEFLGAKALELGMINRVGTLEDAYVKAEELGQAKQQELQKLAALGYNATSKFGVPARASTSGASVADNPTNETPRTVTMQVLTDEQLAAIAAGVDIGAKATTAPAAATPPVPPVEPAAPEASTEPAAPKNEAMELLKSMLAEAQASAAKATAEVESLKAAAAASAAELSSFAAIARASVSTMGIHFGLKAEAVAAMSNATVLAEHARLSQAFQAKYKAGGIAATGQEKPAAKVMDARAVAQAKSLPISH